MVKKVCSKSTLSILCVFILNIILYLRSTQYQAIFGPALRCTGIVVLLIAFTRVPLNRLFNKVNKIIAVVTVVAIPLYAVLRQFRLVSYPLVDGIIILINVGMICIGISWIIGEVFIKKSVSIKLSAKGVLWILFTLIATFGGSDRLWPACFFVIFGIFYIIPFTKEDVDDLVSAVLRGTFMGFVAIQGFAYLFRPFDELRYRGAFYNTNDMGVYYLMVYIMVLVKLYILHKEGSKLWKKAVWFMGAAALIAFQIFTSCRTAWVATAVVTIVYVFVVMRRKWKYKFRTVIAKGFVLLLAVVIAFPLVYLSIRYLPCVHPHPIWYWDEWSEEKVHSWDPVDSDKFTSFSDVIEHLGNQLERFEGLFSIFDRLGITPIRAYAAEKEVHKIVYDRYPNHTLDRVFSNRLSYFRAYLKDSTWWGKPDDEYEIYVNTYYVEGEDVTIRLWHAQNLWVQAIWSFGYIAGGIVIILTVMILHSQFKNVKLSDHPYYVLSLLVTIAYFTVGTMEIVWMSGQLIFTLFFLLQKKVNVEAE
ncbi:hypothetical protein SAMN02910339_00450 [Lachnospiraceae bacterium YSD2013]|nr:hypothetical protein SAMN02910339_00450 [Lachnospiraceae bacterium YSD2013]